MSLVLADRVKETCNSPGTGTVSLLGAATGYQTFSAAIGNANTCYYTIADQTGANWEVGIGTYTSSGNTLARTTVLSSSNSGSLTNFSSGVQDVFVTYPAEKAVYGSGTALVAPSGTILPVANGGTGLTSLTTGYVPYGNGTGALGNSSNYLYTPSTGQLQAPEYYASNGIFAMANTITSNYTVPTNANVILVGPFTVASGVTYTLPAGSRQVLL